MSDIDEPAWVRSIFALAKAKFGLSKKRLLEQVSENVRADLRSVQRLDGAVATAVQEDLGFDRRGALSAVGSFGLIVMASTAVPLIDGLRRSRSMPEKITVESSKNLAAFLRVSLNDIVALEAKSKLYEARGFFSVSEVIQRIVQYRKGDVFPEETLTGVDEFWDSRISEDNLLLHPFRQLLKSREFLRSDRPDQAREALAAIRVHNSNTLPQKLNLELMTAETLTALRNHARSARLLEEIGIEFGELWLQNPAQIVEAVNRFGPVAIIVFYHTHFLHNLLSTDDERVGVVEPAKEMMFKLREISVLAKRDVSKECWNGCLFSSFFINCCGTAHEGLVASRDITDHDSRLLRSSRPMREEASRAFVDFDNQMMYALFQRMENEYASRHFDKGDQIYDHLRLNYKPAITANSMYGRRFGDIERWHGRVGPISAELLQVNSHYLYLKERTLPER